MAMIKFKCQSCKKPLSVRGELAGKRAACPACKKPIVIPAPIAPAADVEALAAAALADPVEVKKEAPKFVEFACPHCDDPIKVNADMAGKQYPCPSCRKIVKVPLPKPEKAKDWRDVGKTGPTAALMNLPEQLEAPGAPN